MKNRTKDQIQDLLLEAIEAKQIYTIRKLRKQLKDIQKKEKRNHVVKSQQ